MEWQGETYQQLRKFRNNLSEVMADIGDSMSDKAKQDFLFDYV